MRKEKEAESDEVASRKLIPIVERGSPALSMTAAPVRLRMVENTLKTRTAVPVGGP